MNVIIMGSIGMVGKEVLKECINNKDITKITIINRRKIDIDDDRIIQVIHDDFNNYEKINKYLKNQNACIYCIGVYTGSVSKDEFENITINYTKNFANALIKESKDVSFSFLSGLWS